MFSTCLLKSLCKVLLSTIMVYPLLNFLQVASFLLYLSDVEEGGETMFPFEVSLKYIVVSLLLSASYFPPFLGFFFVCFPFFPSLVCKQAVN